ncbi:MAG: toxin-antitoxin system YwqK family antitoxin, partial [Cytophagaceae bacterium]
MKPIILLLFSVLLISCSNNAEDKQEAYEMIWERYDDGKKKSVKIYHDLNNRDAYTIKDYYSNGNINFEGDVENGYFKNKKKAYYENGNLMQLIKLSDSTRLDYCCPDGFYQDFYSTGKLEQTHYKLRGAINGPVVLYDTSGSKIAELHVIDDLMNGIEKKYHKNGRIKSIKTFKNDTIIGTAYYFSENGDSLKKHDTYRGNPAF